MKSWILRSAAGVVAAYLCAAFLLLPYLIRTKVAEAVSAATGGHLTVREAAFNPLFFKLTLEGVRFATPQEMPLFTLRRAVVNVELLPLLWGKMSINRVILSEPRLYLEQNVSGAFNFDWLLRRNGAKAQTTEIETGFPAVAVRHFELESGSIDFRDSSRGEPLQMHIEPLGLTLENFDTAKLGSRRDTIHFYAGTGEGGLLDIKTDLRSLDPLALSGTLDYKAGRLYDAWHFLQEISGLEVADGSLRLHLAYDVDLSDLNGTRIDDIRLNLQALRIKPKTEYGDVLRLESATVEGGSVRPLQRVARIGPVTLQGLFLAAGRLEDGSVDWEHYLPKRDANAPDEPSGKTLPWDVLLSRLDLRNAVLRLTDKAIRPQTRFVVDDLNLSARHISTLPHTPLSYRAGLTFNKTMRCRAEGNVSHSPLESDLQSGCTGMDVTWFNPYIEAAARQSLKTFDLSLQRARFGFAADLSARESNRTVAVTLHNANATLDDLLLTRVSSNEKVLGVRALRVKGAAASTAVRKASVQDVSLEGAEIAAARTVKGEIDLAGLVEPKTAAGAPGNGKTQTAGNAAWSAAVHRVNILDARADFRDDTLSPPVTTAVERFNLMLSDVTTDPAKPIGLDGSFAVNGKGGVEIEGKVTPEPLRADLQLVVRRLSLPPFSPYVEVLTYAGVTEGTVTMTGRARYEPAGRKPDLSLRGGFILNGLLVRDTRDRTPLFSLNTLETKAYLFELNPNRLFVDAATLDAFYANVAVDRDRQLNLAALVKPSGEPETAPSESGTTQNIVKRPAFPVRIVRFALKNGAVHFADASLPLPFDTQIHDVNGELLGISTIPEDTAYLRLDGEVDRYGVARAEGSLNMAEPLAFTDIGLHFRNIDLRSLTPYSGKFFGRALDKGRISVALRYHIVGAKMRGDNGIVIQQIKLGRKIESSDALSLPLEFAIALLENDEGVIDIDLPVKGDVGSPKFKWGGVIWGAFVNLITKAVTAPFDLIGAMLGIKGDTLKYVAFEPGKAALDPPSREKLDALAGALAKRPKLGVTVTGTYDDAKDGRALRMAGLLKEALARSGKETVDTAVALDVGLLEPIFRERFGSDTLETLQANTEEAFEKEERRRAYREALLEALIASQPLAAEQLRQLAAEREQTIRAYLSLAHGIVPERVKSKPAEAVETKGEFVSSPLGLDAAQ